MTPTKVVIASSAPAGLAEPPWMKPRAPRCPGEGRDPSTRCSCGRRVGPAFAGAAFDVALFPIRLVSFLGAERRSNLEVRLDGEIIGLVQTCYAMSAFIA